MISLSPVAAGLRGAWLLMRGDAKGVELFDGGPDTAIHSFWAIPLCLPALVCLKLFDWLQAGLPANVPVAMGRYLLLFVVGWLLYVLISHRLATLLNRLPRWPLFLAAWSYTSVAGNTLIALGALPRVLGAPAPVVQLAEIVVLGWALWMQWFGIRLSLKVGPLTATLLLAVDTVVGVAMEMAGRVAG